MQRLPYCRDCALVLFFAVAIGCSEGPRRASVGGTVSVAGKPLERGVITFIPVEGGKGPRAGGEISDGEYSLDGSAGAVVGKCRVEIRGFRKTGRKVNSPHGAAHRRGNPGRAHGIQYEEHARPRHRPRQQ